MLSLTVSPFWSYGRDSLPDGAFEEECVLWYDRQSVPQLGVSCAHRKGRNTSCVYTDVRDVAPVDTDRPALQVDHAEQSLGERALAGTGTSYNPDFLAGLDLE